MAASMNCERCGLEVLRKGDHWHTLSCIPYLIARVKELEREIKELRAPRALSVTEVYRDERGDNHC